MSPSNAPRTSSVSALAGAKPVVGASRRPQRGEADQRARTVVAKGKAASADDGLLAADPRDRRRTGAGDDKPAVCAGVSADAGGRRVVRRADERVARKGRADFRGVAGVVQSGETEADGDARILVGVEPRPVADLDDQAAHDLDGRGEIDMDVGGGADRFRERRAVGVAQPRATARRAPIDADEGDRASHVALGAARARRR